MAGLRAVCTLLGAAASRALLQTARSGSRGSPLANQGGGMAASSSFVEDSTSRVAERQRGKSFLSLSDALADNLVRMHEGRTPPVGRHMFPPPPPPLLLSSPIYILHHTYGTVLCSACISLSSAVEQFMLLIWCLQRDFATVWGSTDLVTVGKKTRAPVAACIPHGKDNNVRTCCKDQMETLCLDSTQCHRLCGQATACHSLQLRITLSDPWQCKMLDACVPDNM